MLGCPASPQTSRAKVTNSVWGRDKNAIVDAALLAASTLCSHAGLGQLGLVDPLRVSNTWRGNRTEQVAQSCWPTARFISHLHSSLILRYSNSACQRCAAALTCACKRLHLNIFTLMRMQKSAGVAGLCREKIKDKHAHFGVLGHFEHPRTKATPITQRPVSLRHTYT